MDTSLTTNTLQPNGGGLQDGQTNLQPQSQSANTQSTGALQQDALGPNAYRSFDGLTVQGAPIRVNTQTATGSSTPEIFWSIFALVTVAAVIAFALYKRKVPTQQHGPQLDMATPPQPEAASAVRPEATPQSTPAKKKQAVKATKKTSASKKVTKKKTSAAKRKKKR
jgi:hypothetical protein